MQMANIRNAALFSNDGEHTSVLKLSRKAGALICQLSHSNSGRALHIYWDSASQPVSSGLPRQSQVGREIFTIERL